MDPNPNQEVNQTTPTSTPTPVANPENKPKKSHKVLFVILGIFIALILVGGIGGGYYYGRSSITKELNPSSPTIPPKDPDIYEGSPTPEAMNNDIKDWKTYTNSNYGFSFMYPNDWTYYESESKEIVYPSLAVALRPKSPIPGDIGYGLISVDIYNNRYDSVQDFCKDKCIDYEEIKIANIPAIKGTNIPGLVSTDIVIFQHNDDIYRIILGLDKSYEETLSLSEKQKILNQILSTFKFTN